MSLAAAAPISVALSNPLEAGLAAFNTNPYFIGITMLLLNLGGRFLAMEVTKEQEKFFQHTWVRAILLFVVVFVATRNVIVAFWLALIIIILLRFLFNENSDMYLFNQGMKKEKFQNQIQGQPVNALSPEEADIYRKLTDKLAKAQPVASTEKEELYDPFQVYMTNMSRLNG
jgi:hypothetical protein